MASIKGRIPPPPPYLDGKSPNELGRQLHILWRYIRHDLFEAVRKHGHTHSLGQDDPLDTPGIPTTISVAAADAGDGPAFAAEDHRHAVTTGVPVAVGAANAEGVSVALSRADHVHEAAPWATADSILANKVFGEKATVAFLGDAGDVLKTQVFGA